ELPTPANLAIDYPSSLQLRVRGSLTGTASYTYDPDFNAATANDVTITNVMLTFGDVKLAGTAEFALVKRTVTADVDGAGTGPLLLNGDLTSLALTVSGLGVHVGTMAHITVSVPLALASLKSATPLVDGRSWTALKMGNVVVSGNVNLGLDGVTAQISVDALDVNLASDTLAPTAQVARLDWKRAFDLDGDGQYDDLLNPGAELPTPTNLAIDYPSSLQLRVRGSLTGTGAYTYDPQYRVEATDVNSDDVTLSNVLVRFGDVR